MTKRNTRRGNTQNSRLFPVPLAGKVRPQVGKGVIKASRSDVSPTFKKDGSPIVGFTPALHKRRMSLWNNGAFTLIELLVVVLIIGLLAAVALPQYNKAIKRARIMDVVQFVKTVEKATDLWLLQNGGFPQEETVLLGKDINLLDIDVSGMLDFESQYEASSVSGNFSVLTLPYCSSSECGFYVE